MLMFVFFISEVAASLDRLRLYSTLCEALLQGDLLEWTYQGQPAMRSAGVVRGDVAESEWSTQSHRT